MNNTKMYACFAFFPNGDVKRWKYVRNLKSFGEFLTKVHSGWKYFNVYDKGTKSYLKRFYPGNLIPKVIPALVVLLSNMLTQEFTFSKKAAMTYENTFNKTTFTNGFNNSATIPTGNKQKGGVLC
jgi:hypothetical protein